MLYISALFIPFYDWHNILSLSHQYHVYIYMPRRCSIHIVYLCIRNIMCILAFKGGLWSHHHNAISGHRESLLASILERFFFHTKRDKQNKKSPFFITINCLMYEKLTQTFIYTYDCHCLIETNNNKKLCVYATYCRIDSYRR